MILQYFKITHIINCSPQNCKNNFENQIQYLNIEILDNWEADLFTHIDTIFKFIQQSQKANGRVLVHCYRGVSRSPSVVIAYIIKSFNINENQALKLCKSRYQQADPNASFILQLSQFYKNQQDSQKQNINPQNFQNKNQLDQSNEQQSQNQFNQNTQDQNTLYSDTISSDKQRQDILNQNALYQNTLNSNQLNQQLLYQNPFNQNTQNINILNQNIQNQNRLIQNQQLQQEQQFYQNQQLQQSNFYNQQPYTNQASMQEFNNQQPIQILPNQPLMHINQNQQPARDENIFSQKQNNLQNSKNERKNQKFQGFSCKSSDCLQFNQYFIYNNQYQLAQNSNQQQDNKQINKNLNRENKQTNDKDSQQQLFVNTLNQCEIQQLQNQQQGQQNLSNTNHSQTQFLNFPNSDSYFNTQTQPEQIKNSSQYSNIQNPTHSQNQFQIPQQSNQLAQNNYLNNLHMVYSPDNQAINQFSQMLQMQQQQSQNNNLNNAIQGYTQNLEQQNSSANNQFMNSQRINSNILRLDSQNLSLQKEYESREQDSQNNMSEKNPKSSEEIIKPFNYQYFNNFRIQSESQISDKSIIERNLHFQNKYLKANNSSNFNFPYQSQASYSSINQEKKSFNDNGCDDFDESLLGSFPQKKIHSNDAVNFGDEQIPKESQKEIQLFINQGNINEQYKNVSNQNGQITNKINENYNTSPDIKQQMNQTDNIPTQINKRIYYTPNEVLMESDSSDQSDSDFEYEEKYDQISIESKEPIEINSSEVTKEYLINESQHQQNILCEQFQNQSILSPQSQSITQRELNNSEQSELPCTSPQINEKINLFSNQLISPILSSIILNENILDRQYIKELQNEIELKNMFQTVQPIQSLIVNSNSSMNIENQNRYNPINMSSFDDFSSINKNMINFETNQLHLNNEEQIKTKLLIQNQDLLNNISEESSPIQNNDQQNSFSCQSTQLSCSNIQNKNQQFQNSITTINNNFDWENPDNLNVKPQCLIIDTLSRSSQKIQKY